MDSLHIIYWSMAGVGTVVMVGLLVLGMDHDIDFGGDVDVGADVGFDIAHDVGAGHEGPGHTGDCFGDTCSRECVCGKCPPLPEDAVACRAPTEERG